MLTAIIVLHVIVSVVIIVTVLLQTGKGASIGATFGGASSQTLFGSSGPASFLMKITIVCAVIFMFTSLYITFISGKGGMSSIMSETPAVKAIKTKTGKAPAAKAGGEEAAPLEKKALKPAPLVKEEKPEAPRAKPKGKAPAKK